MAKKQEKPVEKEIIKEDQIEQSEASPIEHEEITLTSGAEYWDFEEEPEFIGVYDSLVQRKQDDPKTGGKEGDIIGFNFIDEENEMHIIGNSYAIEEALQMDFNGKKVMDSGYALKIVFKGQGQKADGQKFNRFKISILRPKS